MNSLHRSSANHSSTNQASANPSSAEQTVSIRSVNQQTRGRLLLIALVLVFALPALAAKLILDKNWYQSGVTNKGVLIEPRTTFSMLGMKDSLSGLNTDKPLWQMGYLVPETCEELCRQQIHLLKQSYSALGKYKSRVVPVLYITGKSDPNALEPGLAKIEVPETFTHHVSDSEYLLSDPLGQLVMKYPDIKESSALISQHKALLADFRKLLKLSRVG